VHSKLPSYLIALLVAVGPLTASEYHGVVQFGGLPVPGATVTATQGDQKSAAVTDRQGAFSFPDLRDGAWTIDIGMPGFAPIHQDVNVIPAGQASEWELKILPY